MYHLNLKYVKLKQTLILLKTVAVDPKQKYCDTEVASQQFSSSIYNSH